MSENVGMSYEAAAASRSAKLLELRMNVHEARLDALESAGTQVLLSNLVRRHYALHAAALTPEGRRLLADAVKLIERHEV